MTWGRRWTPLARPRSRNKYGAKRVPKLPAEIDGRRVTGGRSFASQLEADLFTTLCLMEKGGLLRDIEQQVTVYLTEARVRCIPDFRVFSLEKGYPVFHEAKGFESQRWSVILQLWRHYGPGPLYHWRAGRSGSPYVHEVIVPKLWTPPVRSDTVEAEAGRHDRPDVDEGGETPQAEGPPE